MKNTLLEMYTIVKFMTLYWAVSKKFISDEIHTYIYTYNIPTQK